MTQKGWKWISRLLPCWLLLGCMTGVAGQALSQASSANDARTSTPAAASGETAKRVFRISGVVVSSRDGSPVPHCELRVTDAAQGQGRGGAAFAGAAGFQGRFAGGPVGGLVGIAGGFGRAGGSPQIDFRAGQPGGGGGRRTGSESTGSSIPEPAITDARGQFSLVVPHAGVWRLIATARGFRPQSYAAHDGFWAGVVVSAAAPETALRFPLAQDGIISGTVYDETGEAVRKAQVRVERVQPATANVAQRMNNQAGFGTTDDRGSYEISGLAPGDYRLRVTARPWYATVPRANNGVPSPDPSLDVVYPETWFPAATDENSATVVALSGGEERQADFHLTPIPSIHLRIPRGPEAAEGDRGSRTPVVQRGGDGMVQAVVTTSGTEWDIGGLAPGSYTVRMGFGQDQPATQIKVSAGASTVVGLDQVAVSGTPVSVTADGVEDGDVRQITLVNVETGESVAANGGRRGRGRNGDDDSPAPPAGWTITAPAGRYGVFLNGAPGLYLLGLSATGAEVVGRTVTLNGGTPKLVVHAAKGRGTVEGMAKRDGRPISGAMVLLVPAGFGQPSNVAPVVRNETNTDGSFTLAEILPAEYILLVLDGGWSVNWRDSGTLMRYLASGTAVDLRGGGTVRKAVEAVEP